MSAQDTVVRRRLEKRMAFLDMMRDDRWHLPRAVAALAFALLLSIPMGIAGYFIGRWLVLTVQAIGWSG
ncbi:hypothetical protein [Roseivivax isoporae]|uniref:Uncharacterized protein n=1 Tax=Roseivivax isoporae LMG 25204 TaxID=1449351 RepID=X7F1H3_9RHOB|nr:hypothetical protein [Roseivivax isoporae]ETX26615.1 hypothetical protein RISW2_21715 [Roseivivax isoporae LMG 25204]